MAVCGEYLGAVLSHGVVVEAGLGLELLVAMLTFESILQLQSKAETLARGLPARVGLTPLTLHHAPGSLLPSDTPPCVSAGLPESSG